MSAQQGFRSPNYTQTPNDLFTMLPDMRETELRATLIMIRQTFGFHRGEFKMGVAKLARLSGLSRQGALDGAQAAEKRGTFRRSNPDVQGEAEWELVVPLQPAEAPLQPVEAPPLISRGQVGVKESIKKDIKKNTRVPSEIPDFLNLTVQQAAAIPEMRIFRDATGRIPGNGQYETVWETIRALGSRGTAEHLHPFYKEWCARGFSVSNLAWLTEWAIDGKIPEKLLRGRGQNGKKPIPVQPQRTEEEKRAIRERLSREMRKDTA